MRKGRCQMGSFTNKERKIYQNICHLSERGVLNYMNDLLGAKYGKESVVATKSYVFALGDIPVALVAHADTVFKMPPRIDNFYYDQEKDVIWNPEGAGADDRAGVYAISYILRSTKLRPHIIITTGEESGCIGAGKMIVKVPQFPGDLRFMIQLDRRGKNDSVYYDCDNKEFEQYINPYGFETEWGSFTDISLLAPAWKVAAVNFSIGYEDEHHEIERLHVDWMYETIQKTCRILYEINDATPKFEYIEAIGWHYPGWHSAWYDYDDEDDLPLTSEWDHCFMCNHLEKKSDMIPIWYPHGIRSYNMCMECFGDCSRQIVFCKNCNRGIFLSCDEARKIPDLNNWTCEECKNGKSIKGTDTAAVQPSDSVQPGCTAGQNGRVIRPVGGSQKYVYDDDGWDDLRAGYASDL